MMKDVKGALARGHEDLEGLAALGVVDRDRDLIAGRVPEHRHVDAVVATVGELSEGGVVVHGGILKEGISDLNSPWGGFLSPPGQPVSCRVRTRVRGWGQPHPRDNLRRQMA